MNNTVVGLQGPSYALLVQHLHHIRERSGEMDFAASDPARLIEIADYAEDTAGRALSGLTAVGRLLGCLPCEGIATIDRGTLASVGLLVEDLASTASACIELAAHCRRETVDFNPI